jgi:16S rRNA pseudouridine516 synthase
MNRQRLDKVLASAGWGTRSDLRSRISAGRVYVDGRTVKNAAAPVDPAMQVITLDGRDIDWLPQYTYMLHKPAGVLTATADAAQPTVLDLLPPRLRQMGLTPVGRLDKDTTGLLLLTTDGAMSHALTAPRRHIDKVYRVHVDGVLTAEMTALIKDGLLLPDGLRCLPGFLEIKAPDMGLLTIFEGKYHQVKRMMASLGCPVLALHRLSVGGLCLDKALAPGEFRRLTEDELRGLTDAQTRG